MPPSPKASDGTTPSRRAAISSSTPGGACCSTSTAPRPSARSRRVRIAHLSLGGQIEDERTQLRLVREPLAAQLRGHGRPELGEDRRSIVLVARDASRDDSDPRLAQRQLRLVLGEPPTMPGASRP